ncbi:hypothetical protein T4D_13020 [Trichinella pseudospiralis]|uniref:Uncharacterized protein n=1 Tax=Trichinella pseudospiralis TaxID=6337 RepID=A0A0V1DR55_TRIPS|nr:hypothetical protein T4D_13020 [Trichinella pseudospiralis]
MKRLTVGRGNLQSPPPAGRQDIKDGNVEEPEEKKV